MSNTSDQTTKPSKKTRLIIGEVGVDTETGIVGKGHSYDNGKTFTVDDTIYGRIYHADDHGKIWKGIQDKVKTVVEPAKSAADSAVAYANDAIEKSRVNSQAIDDINSAVSDAASAAAVARSDGLRAWNAAQSNVNLIDLNYASASASISSARTEAIAAADEAKASASAAKADIVAVRSDVATVQAEVTDFGPALKSAQSDAGKALTQIADTASSLSETKAALTSDVAVAKNLANAAQTTANNAVESAGENAKALTSQANALSDARKAMDSGIANAKELANTAQTTANSAIESASSVANDLAAVASQAKTNTNGITKVTSDVGLLQTTVADNSGNISTIQETTKQIQQAVSDNSGNITVAKQTANSAVTVASDASSNATVANQTASQASITANNASGQAASAVLTAQGALTTASNAKSDATVAIQTASGASLTAINAKSDATVAKQTASEAKVQASNAESDFAQISIRANKIEANVANNSGAIASVQQTANGLTTTVADITSNGGGRNLATGTDQEYVMGYGIPNTVWQDGYAYLKLPSNVFNGEILPQYPHSFHYNLTPGQEYTQTVWLETDATVKDLSTVQITWFTGAGHDVQPARVQKLGQNSYKVVSTYTWPGKTENTVRLFDIENLNSAFDLSTGTYLKFGKLMLENGIISHDWSPAPDDLQNQFTQTKESIDGIITIINDPKTGLNATYQTAAGNTTTISNAQGDIAKLKTRADGFDAEFATANGNISKLQTDASGTTQTLANTKSDVAVLQSRADGLDAKYADAAGDINTIKADASGIKQTLVDAKGDISTLQATATGLKNTLTDAQGNISTLQSDVSGLKKTTSDNAGNIATLQASAKTLISQMSSAQGDISTLKQTASDFSSKVSGMETSLSDANSKINDITSNGGGRNLVENTGTDIVIDATSSNAGNFKLDQIFFTEQLKQGDVITVSADSTLTGTGTLDEYQVILFDYVSLHSRSTAQYLKAGKRDSVTLSLDNLDGIGDTTLLIYAGKAGETQGKKNVLHHLMVEKGTVAHDWSPAPEDTDAKITTNTTAIEQNKNAITLKADQTTVDKINGTVNQLQSSLTVQAGQIQTKVSASDVSGMLAGYATQEYTQSLVTQKADDWNVNLTKLKNDTQTSLTNLAVGVEGVQAQVYNSDGTSKITQLSNLIQSKVGTDDFNNLKQAVGLQKLDSADINNMKTNGHYFVHSLANNPIGGWVYVDVTGDGSIRIRQDVYQDNGTEHKYRRWVDTNWTDWEEGATYTEINQLQDAINLRVTKGDLISQINLQAGTSLIQSNKLVLDAKTTVITGEAFIPSAAISSIQADKIMLGPSSLYDSNGTLNLVNVKDGTTSKISVTQGSVNFDGVNKTASIIRFASDNNTNAFTVNPTGATVTPTLFFERFDQPVGHWLGFTRNSIQEEGVAFNTWDNYGERFAVACHARFEKNLRTLGTLSQGSWDGTNGKPEAGVLTIKNGNTIWSGSDFLAVGSNVTGTYTGVWAKAFVQQSTLSAKTNIETVDPKYALDLVNKTDIRSYQYKSDVAQGYNKRYTSLIIDDVNDVSKYYAPNEFTNEERTGRDDGSAVGYLFLAVKELTRRIKILEEKLNG